MVFSAIAGAALLALVFLIMTRFNFESMKIEYSADSKRKFLIIGAGAVSLAIAFFGALAGFNSAGQRRNTTPKLSWMGFFLNSAVLLAALCTFIFWFLSRDEFQAGT
ncbi:MAG: hypothetical protein KDA32_04145 [Phycisphaerales bacterium]|nr:hypothetical protein [Phycisphaerales bacterium]